MTTIAERIAALKLQQAGNEIPVGPPPPSANIRSPATAPQKSRPPPPPRPNLPARPDRNQTSSVPPANDRVPSNGRPIGNQPEQLRPSTNSPARPPLPTRNTGQASQSSSSLVPTLPPRRPSNNSQPDVASDVSRRGSADSQSSIATTRSSISAMSNATSFAPQGDRNRIKAPEFNASTLPVLPPRRTQEEKEAADRKYGNVRASHPLRQAKSSPRVAQVQEETTPPPPPRTQPRQASFAAPPGLPTRANVLPDQRSQLTQAEREAPIQPPRPRPSALTMGFGTGTRPQAATTRPDAPTAQYNVAPPIPAASKPDLTAIMALKPKSTPTPSAATSPPIPAGQPPIAISSYPQFNEILSSNAIVVSDFYADWCGPCRNFAPDYERLSKEYSRPGQIAFIKINTDHNPDIRDAYKIKCWPTLIIFDRGSQVQHYKGAYEYGITSTVEELAEKAGINLAAPAAASSVSVVANGTSVVPNNNNSQTECLLCRDFSAPDAHAARFPRESLPSQDIGWLAQQLTSPFPSLTDKARVLFTWLHHNVAYNTEAFFANNVQPSTPQSTLATGLAVCEGYAGLFAALALKAGLEAFVVGGASKGYGYTQLQPGDALPQFKSDHAWNVVRIDDGEWKLIDTCWGAGSVDRNTGFTKGFKPIRFTQSNNDFGLDHFPEDASRQYRTDGRTMSWEEFQRGNKNGTACDVYGMADDEGFATTSFQPLVNPIIVSQMPGPTVRFAFQKKCPHWDPVRHGKGPHYLYILAVQKPGEKATDLAAEFDSTGDVWWCDVPISSLLPGSTVHIMALTKFDNRDGRGLTKQDYLRKKGRVGWGGGYLCAWSVK